jgi:histidinol phosphatase-like PHP family hydrolase
MDEAAVVRQGAEIDAANEELARGGRELTILKSIEMDLDGAGGGDTDPAVLASLDLVLGTFHTALRSADDQTARYLGALRNPHVHVLGHPRGRRWNRRPGLTADWERVFDEAAARDKALEIDAYPHRQDLQPELLPLAAAAGVRISIGTDAHDETELRFLEVGLAAARAAGIPKDRILNFMSADDVRAWASDLSRSA